MKKFMIVFLFSFVLLSNVHALDISIYSDNALLYNVEENRIMYEKNKDEKAYIASLTKVMTALVVLDQEMDLTKKIDLKKVDYEYLSKMDLMVSTLDTSKTYTYLDLLYSFILESSADCGYALVLDVSKNVDEFSKLMNDKAKEIGMASSHFSNPVGLDEKTHYSTMSDMLKLMQAAMKNKTLKKIMDSREYTTSNGITVKHTFSHYLDRFKLDMPYLKGGKTGYNDIPGYALMSYANKNDSTYILITTNASYSADNPRHFRDAKKLYEYFFNHYGYHTIVKKNDTLLTLDTKFLKEDKIIIKASKDVVKYMNHDYDKEKISFVYDGEKEVTYHFKDYLLGTLKVYYGDELLETIDIHLNQKVHFSILKFVLFYKYVIGGIVFVVILLVIFLFIMKKRKNGDIMKEINEEEEVEIL